MNKDTVLNIAIVLMIVLGLVMIYLGAFYAPKVMYPPVVTGVGFFVIAWVFNAMRTDKNP